MLLWKKKKKKKFEAPLPHLHMVADAWRENVE